MANHRVAVKQDRKSRAEELFNQAANFEEKETCGQPFDCTLPLQKAVIQGVN
jgi:hypothetical protein